MALQIEDTLPPLPGTGGCVCGPALFYVRAERVGGSGHFHCPRSAAGASPSLQTWSPGGATSADDEPPRG